MYHVVWVTPLTKCLLRNPLEQQSLTFSCFFPSPLPIFLWPHSFIPTFFWHVAYYTNERPTNSSSKLHLSNNSTLFKSPENINFDDVLPDCILKNLFFHTIWLGSIYYLFGNARSKVAWGCLTGFVPLTLRFPA